MLAKRPGSIDGNCALPDDQGDASGRPPTAADSGGSSTPTPRIAGLSQRAEQLLIGISVYRQPADSNALAFHLGEHDWTAARTPDRRGPAPPYQPPADLAGLLAECTASEMLRSSGHGRGGSARSWQVDDWVASELHERLATAGRRAALITAHRRAAEYWHWRAAAWPQDRQSDLRDLLEARYHLFCAGDAEQASEVARDVCAQLHAWGDLAREAELIQSTLEMLPTRSASRAHWMQELGAIYQVRGEYGEAYRCYAGAVQMFAVLGDYGGIARGQHSLGVLAQAQGDYRRAERHYKRSNAAEQKAAGNVWREPARTLPPVPAPSGGRPDGTRTRAATATGSQLTGTPKAPGTAPPRRPAPEPPAAAEPPAAPEPQAAPAPPAAPEPHAAPTPPAAPGPPAAAEPQAAPARPAASRSAGPATKAAPTVPNHAPVFKPAVPALKPVGELPAVTITPASRGPGTQADRSGKAQLSTARLPKEQPVPAPSSAGKLKSSAARSPGSAGRLKRSAARSPGSAGRLKRSAAMSPGIAGRLVRRGSVLLPCSARRLLKRISILLPPVIALGLAVLTIAGISAAVARPAGQPGRGGSGASAAGAAGAARAAVAEWVAAQVSRSAVIACDPALCAALHQRGLPAGDLLALGPGGPADPLASDVIVATAAVREEFGSRLAAVYAPTVLASFGTGSAAIQVRAIAPDGAAAYARAARADLAVRQRFGTELLRNRHLIVSSGARAELSGGRVDARLMAALATLADIETLRVLAFGDAGPGASAGVPLRAAEIAPDPKDTATSWTRTALRFLDAQQAPFRPSEVALAHPAGAGRALLIEYPSPSPLGLLEAPGTSSGA